MTDGQPLICTLTYNPTSDATITIEKDGVIVKTGKTDESGIFRTVFSETREYTIKINSLHFYGQTLSPYDFKHTSLRFLSFSSSTLF